MPQPHLALDGGGRCAAPGGGGCFKVAFDAPAPAANALAEKLEDIGLAVRLVPPTPETAKTWRVIAYGADTPTETIVARLKEWADAAGLAARDMDVTRLPHVDWVRDNQRHFAPLRIGRFHIHDSDHRGGVPANAWPVWIDAATAFGTGGHATTHGCLQVIDALARAPQRHRPRHVLDIGCGSGILSVAAARALHGKVVACDIDPEAVRVARENCHRNGVARFVQVTRVRAQHDPRLSSMRGAFDLILANILAAPLVRLAPLLTARLAPGGRLVLSGMLLAQDAPVLRAYIGRGVFPSRRIVRHGWLTLVLRRPAARPDAAAAPLGHPPPTSPHQVGRL